MLDFDFVCGREQPSVVASTYPFTGDHKQKFYFGHKVIHLLNYSYYAYFRSLNLKVFLGFILKSFFSLNYI